MKAVDGQKYCPKCQQTKPVEEFYKGKSQPDGYCQYCKSCMKTHVKGYYSEHAEERRSYARRYQQENKDKRRAYLARYKPRRQAWMREYHLLSNYGLTPADYDRMLEEQQGVCAICHQTADEGEILHVDHCHNGGGVRGLLCRNCNHMLGHAKDDPQRLRAAADYLEHYYTDRGIR